MRRVLEICIAPGIGGTEYVSNVFCKYLDKSSFAVFKGYVFGDCTEPRPGADRTVGFEGDENLFRAFLQDESIDVVHAHGVHAGDSDHRHVVVGFLRVCRDCDVKVIATSPFAEYDPEVDSFLRKRLFVSQTCLLKFLHKYSDRGIEREKYDYAYNPVDLARLDEIRASLPDRDEIRAAYGIPKDAFVVGKVCRADPWKWDRSFLSAVEITRRTIPSLHALVRAAPGRVIRGATRRGNAWCHFLPETTDRREVCETIAAMDVMLHTSRIGETFGISMVEGMFFGLPIVTSSTDFMVPTLFDRDNAQVEVVLDGVNGFVEVGAVRLGKRLVQLANDDALRKRMSDANKEDVPRRFGMNETVGRVATILQGGAPATAGEWTMDDYRARAKPGSPVSGLLANIDALAERYLLNRTWYAENHRRTIIMNDSDQNAVLRR